MSSQQSIFGATANMKIDEILKLTREIHTNLNETKSSKSPNGSEKLSFASILKQHNEKLDRVNTTIEQIKNHTPKSNVTQNFSPLEFTPNGKRRRQINNAPNFKSLDSPITSRSRTQYTPMDAETKSAMKSRQLISGTGNKSNCKLIPVLTAKPSQQKQNETTQIPTRPKLTKSIYISRFNTATTPDDIASFIKNEIQNIDENDFSTRLLVKKDADLSKLTFVSFRVMCNKALFIKLMNPDFWPNGIHWRFL